MGSEDIGIAKAFGSQTPSSSTQSTPEKKGHQNNASRGEDFLEYLKNGPKRELLHTFFDKEKKHSASSKYKITDKPPKTSNKGCKNQESKKHSLSQPQAAHNQASKKLQRKGECPIRFQAHSDLSPNAGCSNTWICKNASCRATLTLDDTFCKRCSCCICHLFDDNKDPSLWLVCTSESDDRDSCGLSCHIECALPRQKVGVVDLGQLMQLDGSYCCASCGKISGILGCWKKQLMIAKNARRVDILCYRISLSYRLLDGTSKYKDLFEIAGDAKAKLETEVGSIDGVSASMARGGIVSRLSVSADLQRLCSLAIEKADSWLSTISNGPHHREDSLPAACRFQFEEVSSSSLIIVLKEICSSPSDNIKGFKLWFCKSREETQSKEPICIFPRAQRWVLISNLQPCTEYTFRIISYSDSGDLGHSEAKCFTKSVEILHKIYDSPSSMDRKNDAEGSSSGKGETKEAVGSSGFKVRDLGKVLRLAWAQEDGCFDGFCSNDVEECCGPLKSETDDEDKHPFVAHELDLNVESVPDLNAEVTPIEDSRDEDIGCSSEQAAEAEDDVISHGTEKDGLVRSNGSGDSQTWLVRPIKEVPAVESRAGLCGKRARSTKEDSDSTLINGSPFRISGGSVKLDESYEYCVKIIRWLECGGHIEKEFRMKFLTWFSLRSTEQERRVVNTFIKTLIDDPSSLAGQLIDSFLEIVSSKRPRNGFCSKLWH